MPHESVRKTASAQAVPLCRPSITEREVAAATEAIRSGWLAHGVFNERFEEAFAEVAGATHAISLNSCTSALELALKAHDIRGEVITPSFTWVATANSIVTSGATPHFCEVDPATRNVTAKTIEAAITPRTEAVIVVHYGGQPCRMDEIVDLCRRHNLLLIEDSAETIGATWGGRPVGSFGIGCFSFFPTKNITTGEGGMLTCSDGEVARRARAIASHGVASTTLARERVDRPWLRAAERPGHNYRMSNVLAAIGFEQLKRMPDLNMRRQKLAHRYDHALAQCHTDVSPPEVMPAATHVYQTYSIRVPAAKRDAALLRMRSDGIGASVHFDPPVHKQPYYESQNYPCTDLQATEALCSSLISLPLFPDMTEAEQDRVIASLSEALA